jgi:hypothetical protein
MLSTGGFIVKTISPLTKINNWYISKSYKNNFSEEIFIRPRIAIALKEDCSIDVLLHNFQNVLNVIKQDGHVYLFDCALANSDEIIDIVMQIHEYPEVKWCEPIISADLKLCNTKYTQQYYLKNTGQNEGTVGMDINVEPAWDITTGSSSVKVSVIDEGVDFDHEDMFNTVLFGYSIGSATELGRPSIDSNAHGMACAGIIAANDNSIGIKGVAHGVKIVPVNIFPNTTVFVDDIVNAITWAYSNADILSCSWTCNASQYIENAFNTAMTNGRNGKGTIVVCSAGNDSSNSISFPASIDGTIAVGAIDRNGQVCSYSNQGPELTLVAFGGYSDIVTTDRMGSLGYITLGDWNYMPYFDGTSAACPQVAGVVALMLSENPNLTEMEVRSILVSTARKLSGYTYYSGRNDATGYGLVNAAAAVLKAMKPSITGPTVPQSSSVYSINNLPSSYYVSWSWKNGATVPIASGTPSSNSCTISNSSKVYINDVLVAAISQNGILITTIEKPINSGANFTGTYSQEGGYVVSPINGSTWYDPIPSTAFADGDGLSIHRKHLVTISSSLFSTSTLTRDNGNGVFPASWNHSGSTVTYTPPTTGGSIIIAVTGRNDFGYDVYKFSLALPPDIIGPPLNMNLNAGDYTLQLSFDVSATCDDGSGTRTVSSSYFLGSDDNEFDYSEGPTWLVSVANVLTGDIVYRGNLTGLCPTIPTTGWQPGIYAVQAVIDGTPLSAKIYIR